MSKLSEANNLIIQAEKRKPEYDVAVECFTKAALIFRNNKMFKEAAEIYERAAQAYFNNGSYFHCAKQYEAASQMYRELKNYEKVVRLIMEAGRLLQENGTPDSASYVYEKAAKSLDEHLPEASAEFYEKSCRACEIEEKFHEAANMANNAARIWVRLKNYTEAERLLRVHIDCVIKANPSSIGANVAGYSDITAVPKVCGRAVTVLIMLCLKREDEVAALKIYNEALERWRFVESDDFNAVRCLLYAVEQMDKKAFLQAAKDPCFRNLDLDYARLIKEINFPYSDESEVSSAVTNPNLINNQQFSINETKPITGDSTGQTQEPDEEEMDEDIC